MFRIIKKQYGVFEVINIKSNRTLYLPLHELKNYDIINLSQYL